MLEIRLLGKFEIVQNGQVLELPLRAAQSLLAWLLLHPGIAHRRERLAGLLWPDSSEENALNNLRRALWRLRQAIPDGYIAADRLTIRWQKDAPLWLDVALLQEEADGKLAAGVNVYAGDLLPGFYDEWVSLERERLAALHDERMARLLERLLVEGEWRAAIAWAEKWISHGHAPEPAYRALMTAHASQGNSAAALAAFQRCTDALERELDVPPSAETAALAASIRHSQFTPSTGSGHRIHHSQFSSPQSPNHPFTQSNLPAPTTPLIGRASELSHLVALLADPSQRLVTILGPGGMGKSRLALAAAQAALPGFPDGVFFVPLTAADGPGPIVTEIAASLGFVFLEDRRPPQQQIFDYLRRRRLLLLLDNFDHLLEATPLLVALLHAAPGVKLLVTSRQRLRLAGETLLSLGGLDVPAQEAEGAAEEEYSAVALFVQSARRLRRDFAPQTAWAEVVRICRLVGGMPLGLLLAASWVDVLTPGEIAAEISRSLDFLSAEFHDLDPRHRSLRAVFAQSWQRLAPEEQQALMALSVFAGGFDREAAQSVADASLPILTRLVDRALLWRVGAARYDLHELVRQFAGEALLASRQATAIRSRHSAFYAAHLAQHAQRLHSGQRQQTLAAIAAESANGLVAWQWAIAAQETDSLDGMDEALAAYLLHNGRYADGERLYAAAADGLTGESAARRLRLLLRQAYFCIQQARWETARLALDRVDQILRSPLVGENELLRERGLALNWQAHLDAGPHPDLARQKFAQALVYFRRCGDVHWTIQMLIPLGWQARRTGDYREVQRLMDECVALCRSNGNADTLAGALELLAFSAIEQGAMAQAEECLQESLAAREGAGNVGEIVRAWRNLGVLLLLQGRFAESESRLEDAAARYTDLGEDSGLLVTTIWQGMARLHQGDYAQARRYGEKGMEQAQKANHPGVLANGLLLLGSIALAEGENGRALTLLSESVEKYQSRNQKHELAIALATLAYAQHGQGDSGGALASIRRGLALVTPQALFPRAMAAPLLALFLRAADKHAEAVALHALTQKYPYIASSRWFSDVAGKELEALAASLPPDVCAAAEERGRARELPEMTAALLALLA